MKFINLLKKELSELLNKQMIISLVVTLSILMLVGNIMKTTINDAVSHSYSINLCDLDDTELTQNLITTLKKCGAEVNIYKDCTGDDYSTYLSENSIKNLIIIPKGFSDNLKADKAPEIISVSLMNSAAAMSNISNNNSGGITLIEKCITNSVAVEAGLTAEQISLMNSPVSVSEKTVVADKSAAISVESIINKVMIQNMILPIVVFVLIMMTSQMLISAISNEKIDKTLETLLSAPVSRSSVIGAKMLAAAVVALVNASAYTLGFSVFVSGATDSIAEEAGQAVIGEVLSVESALAQLGLALSPIDYILVGIQLFLTIMICLSVSLILGAMVNDTKSSQNMITPILMLAMIPYLISMMADINSLPTVFKVIVYAIPFTHTFSAMPNLMFGNTAIFFGGLVYQIIVFAICMFLALKLFKSDKIFTISLNLGQKKKYKKSSAAADEE